MVAKEDIPINFAGRLINGGPLVLITVSDGCNPNIFTVAWHMPVSRKPLSVAISVGTSNYSHDIIRKTGEYVINVPTAIIIDKVVICGTTSGRSVNKFE
ncbi:MAG: flavin reductase family protein, partial [Candidatus Omnitrophica bacterium]|nr:flavin reductase family protein [Candidatus Omnitrophota bacterium]